MFLDGKNGTPDPQGQYYCSVGTGKCIGKEFLDEALDLALSAGLELTGSNIEVCQGQMEIQVCYWNLKPQISVLYFLIYLQD